MSFSGTSTVQRVGYVGETLPEGIEIYISGQMGKRREGHVVGRIIIAFD